MIKKGIHKFFSMTLALLVLLSTFSFTIEKHFCGSTLIDTAIFTKLQSCDMDMNANQMASMSKSNCCNDQLEVVKGQNELTLISFEDFHLDQQLFIASFVYTYSNLFEGLPQQTIPHKNYSPPNLVLDIHVLDQVFII